MITRGHGGAFCILCVRKFHGRCLKRGGSAPCIEVHCSIKILGNLITLNTSLSVFEYFKLEEKIVFAKSASHPRMKTCYYELLLVESTVSDAELKKAYRRKALQLHPDKNPDDVDAATARFALVRAAYEVLSDPQERSWYDSHKSSILRDDDDFTDDPVEMTVPSISEDEILRYFNPALYSVIDDSQCGFFRVACGLFERLAKEEVMHGKAQRLSEYNDYKDDNLSMVDAINSSLLLFPRIGNSTSDYATHVRQFYNTWSSFQTIKSFNWVDEYRYSTAPDRKTRRLMERENKKARDAAKKSYNETVRSYVSFIRKRDPRVKAGIAQFELNRKRQLQQELEEQAKAELYRQKVKRAMDKNLEYAVQDWETLSPQEMKDMENMISAEYNISSDSSTDSEFEDFEFASQSEGVHEFECVVCNKTFKNKNQFETHENSKKHRKTLRQLKWEMRKEGIDLGIDKDDIDLSEFETASSQFALDDEVLDDDVLENDSGDASDEELSVKISRVVPDDVLKDVGEKNANDGASQELQFEHLEVDNNIDDNSDEELNARVNVLHDGNPKHETKAKDRLVRDLEDLNVGDSGDEDWSISNKKKGKKAKKNAPKGSRAQVSSTMDKVPTAESCAVCLAGFASRNQLFTHVKQTGHAVAVKKSRGKKNKQQ